MGNGIKFFKASALSKIKKLEKTVVEEVSINIEKSARSNFNRARFEVPADNPNVTVIRTKSSPTSAIVSCYGDQVLFIEFGAGVSHATETSTMLQEGAIETAPRKAGVTPPMYNIGGYGKHKGLDDSWVYLSITGRESLHSHRYGMNRRGEFRMFTSGIRPVRALWRARNNAIKRLRNPRIKKLPTRYLPSTIE